MPPVRHKRLVAVLSVAFALATLGAAELVDAAGGDAPAPGVWAGR